MNIKSLILLTPILVSCGPRNFEPVLERQRCYVRVDYVKPTQFSTDPLNSMTNPMNPLHPIWDDDSEPLGECIKGLYVCKIGKDYEGQHVCTDATPIRTYNKDVSKKFKEKWPEFDNILSRNEKIVLDER